MKGKSDLRLDFTLQIPRLTRSRRSGSVGRAFPW